MHVGGLLCGKGGRNSFNLLRLQCWIAQENKIAEPEGDLVRRTSGEEQTQPEAYKFENRWFTSMAALVSHPRIAERKAVIIITLDNEQIEKQLQSLDSSAGKFAMEQVYTDSSGTQRTNVIAFSKSVCFRA